MAARNHRIHHPNLAQIKPESKIASIYQSQHFCNTELDEKKQRIGF